MKSVLEVREQAKEEWAKLKPIEEASSVQEKLIIGFGVYYKYRVKRSFIWKKF